MKNCLAVQYAGRCANKQGRGEYAANDAGAEGRRGCHQLQQNDSDDSVPKPILMKKGLKQPLTIAAHFRVEDRQRTDNRAAESQFERYRNINLCDQSFGQSEETQIARCQKTKKDANETER